MSELKLGQMRIPDILEAIADLSNDEVFTPPDLANKVLDMLPEEIWNDSSVKFLDPACKTGVFLREITKRLITGLEDEIPDLQERVNHILTKQVYGLGITELTSLMSRRTLYCATKANSEASVCTEFDNEEGNIKFPKSMHTFNENGKCTVCGAGKDLYYDIENKDNYAYSFLHCNISEVFGNMEFDVIVGNPPYQLSVGNEGGNSSYAIAIYHKFIEKAVDLKAKYISMITPSRWMTNSAEGISLDWVKNAISNLGFKKIVDYEDGNFLFKNVGIAGGVSYFLIEKEYKGECKYIYNYTDGRIEERDVSLGEITEDVIIRDLISQDIIKKVIDKEGNYFMNEKDNFSGLVSQYGFGRNLSTSWRGYSKEKDEVNNVKYYVSLATNGVEYGWIRPSQVTKNYDKAKFHKIIIPRAYGGLNSKQVIGKPRYSEPGSVCSNTYGVICGEKEYSKDYVESVMKYMSTKFFRYLVRILKTTQGSTKRVFQFVPFNDNLLGLNDEDLYKFYKLNEKEIMHIEKTISSF